MEEPEDWRERLKVPPWCPICGGPMRGSKSTSAYYDWGCCWICHIEFVEFREDRWRQGWRPSPEDVQAVRDKLYGK